MSTDVLSQVRDALTEARDAGVPAPGRPTLVRLTGATEHQVRKALTALANGHGEAGPPEAPTLVPAPPTPPQEDPQPAVEPAQATPAGTGRLPRPWPLVFIGLAAAVAIWGGWVRLGELTGFGPINLLPGIGDGLRVNTAVVLPLSVEFYSAYALRVLLASDRLSNHTRRFARRTFVASLAVGGGAQIASHLLTATRITSAPWPVTAVVACVPLLVIGLASGLAALVKQDANAGHTVHQVGYRRTRDDAECCDPIL